MSKNPSDPSSAASTEPPILLSFRARSSREESAFDSPSQLTQPLTLHAATRPTRKRRGEAAEAAFLARATDLNFSVLIPWGDSNRYDSAVDFGRGLLRIQVKSATRYAEGRYRVKTTGANGQVYTIDDIDFFVGYVVPENIWYILPVEALGQRKGIRFYPHTRRPLQVMSERYREAWCLLACKREARGWRDVPSICRSREVATQCAICPLHSPCGTDTPVRRL
ncbi:MAG: group I intron-associated PD-(D/E)XK endonuclease [Candidatus Sulfotelmatobacter sp.]